MASLLAKSLSENNFEVRIAADVAQARKAIDDFDPDAVLLDISLGDGPTGVHLAHALHQTRPDIAVVILTKYADASAASLDGLNLPPNVGFLRKHLVDDIDNLIAAIETVLADRPEEVRQDLGSETALNAITGKRLTILELLSQGYNNNEIALRCEMSTKSVERWIERIYADLGITSGGAINPRVEAARRYYLIAGISQRSES
jgi:DNA-binding NarL/FixJ family response regulator